MKGHLFGHKFRMLSYFSNFCLWLVHLFMFAIICYMRYTLRLILEKMDVLCCWMQHDYDDILHGMLLATFDLLCYWLELLSLSCHIVNFYINMSYEVYIVFATLRTGLVMLLNAKITCYMVCCFLVLTNVDIAWLCRVDLVIFVLKFRMRSTFYELL